MEQFKRYFCVHCAFCLIGIGCFFLILDRTSILSFFMGSMVSILNILGYYGFAKRLLESQHKSNALEITIFYLCKYGFLITLVFVVWVIWPSLPKINGLWFVAGLLSFIFSSLLERLIVSLKAYI